MIPVLLTTLCQCYLSMCLLVFMDHMCEYGYDQHLAFLCVSSYSLRASSHPAVQNSRRYVKVSDYFSDMVIQAHSTVDKPGMNFELTYFDNPKSNLPSSCVNWVTYSGKDQNFFWGGGGTVSHKLINNS